MRARALRLSERTLTLGATKGTDANNPVFETKKDGWEVAIDFGGIGNVMIFCMPDKPQFAEGDVLKIMIEKDTP